MATTAKHIGKGVAKMNRCGKQDAGTLTYQKHQLAPEDLLNFSEMGGFIDDWRRLVPQFI